MVSGVLFYGLSTDLFGLESGFDLQDCGMIFESSTRSSSEETGTSPAASVTISASG